MLQLSLLSNFVLKIIVGGWETKDESMETEDKNKREEVKTKGHTLESFVKESSEQT